MARFLGHITMTPFLFFFVINQRAFRGWRKNWVLYSFFLRLDGGDGNSKGHLFVIALLVIPYHYRKYK